MAVFLKVRLTPTEYVTKKGEKLNATKVQLGKEGKCYIEYLDFKTKLLEEYNINVDVDLIDLSKDMIVVENVLIPYQWKLAFLQLIEILKREQVGK